MDAVRVHRQLVGANRSIKRRRKIVSSDGTSRP